MNEVCSQCIDFCNRNSEKLDLIEFALQRGIRIGEKLDTQRGSSLYFAPAGNYPKDPIVTICGLATSVAAKEYMEREIHGSNNKKTIEAACLRAVYRGNMALNLCLLIKALGISDLIGSDIRIEADGETMSVKNLDITALKNRIGTFVSVPPEVHLTQATCCWSLDHNSKFKKEWWEYSKSCRTRGYLYNLTKKFVLSTCGRVLILLGTTSNDNVKVVNSAITNEKQDIGFYTPYNWRNGKQRNSNKSIFLVHHPANTGFVYNNSVNVKHKSIMYNYYERMDWNFHQEKYGNVGNDTMMAIYRYYTFLSGIIGRIIRS